MQLGNVLQQPALSNQHQLARFHPRPTPICLHSPTRQHSRVRGPTATISAAQKQQQQQHQAVKPLAKPPPRTDPWAVIKKAQKLAETLQVEVKSINKGGLIVAIGEVSAFIPFREVSAHRTQELQDLSYLIGQKIDAKVVSVDSKAGKVLMSEKRVAQSQAMGRLKVGDTQRAIVSKVEDFGAFVTLVDVPSVSGLVHKSELSWVTFMTVDDVIKEGDKVSVKILDIDPVACRINFSIKQLQQDPLTQTLNTAAWGATKVIPEDIQAVIDRLKKQQPISKVIIMEQAVESHLFSQELQLFLTKTEIPGGFLVVARSGSTLQQLQITTNLPRTDMKDLLANVAKMG